MTLVLLFLLAIVAASLWWLSRQRLTSKPWLESGLESVEYGTERMNLPREKVGLMVFLAVSGMLFTLFFSGHFMRQEIDDWRSMQLPNLVWLNGVLLLAASCYLQWALVTARRHERISQPHKGEYPQFSIEIDQPNLDGLVKNLLLCACALSTAFLVCQFMAWQQLANFGYSLSANPANSFFYVLTGLHGFHILGGLIVLGRTTAVSWGYARTEMSLLRIDLCALYWHFLFFIWCVMMLVMLAWTYDPFIELCQRVNL